MSSQASSTVPERRPSAFLQLAPTQSHSNPSSPTAEGGLSGFLQLVPTQSSPYSPSSVPERRLSSFLSLAPTQSASYPQAQRSLQQAKTAPTALEAELHRQRRSSSLSSVGSSGSGSGLRFLKLGPVHWGEHQEDHQGDFAVE